MPPGLHIGTSGWSFAEWKDGFYAGVPRRLWFAHYATHFDTVELNASFYRPIAPALCARWRAAAPRDFRFAAKGQRAITHHARLEGVADLLSAQRESLKALGDSLAVMLWQLPAGFTCDLDRLRAFAALLDTWPETRHALEFRHPSWFSHDIAACLAEHRLSAVLSDAPAWPLWEVATSDLLYLRLHGRRRLYRSAYRPEEIDAWARRIAAWRAEGRTVHVYFDNTMEGAAPRNAAELQQAFGLSTTPRREPVPMPPC